MPDTKSNPESGTNLGEIIERVRSLLTRRRWWILSAACFLPIAVVSVAMKLPDRYISQATLLVVQQQVSQVYVEPDSTTSIPAAVQAMSMEVLSRKRLAEIIDALGLYGNEKDQAVPDLLVERMRKDVEIQPLVITPGRNDFAAFTVAFTAADPRLAREVTSRLTSLFIEQNQKARGDQAANTTKFLSDQLDAAKDRLSEQEHRLQTFKASNLGELPEQQQANLMALTSVREQLAATNNGLLQAQQQRSSIESSLNDRLAVLQTERAALLRRYTAQYPEVIEKDKKIAQLQAALDRVNKGSAGTGKDDADAPEDPVLAGMIQQAQANAAEMENLSDQQRKLKAESEQYEGRLNLTPVREQQLTEILRDYDLFKQDYTSLLNKKLQSQLTTNLEENQEGQQFRLIDPPTLPIRPSGPKRLQIALGGMLVGILLGVALAFLMEMLDTSFHDEKTLSQTFPLPMVLGLPSVFTPAEQRSSRLRGGLEWVAGCVMILAMFAAELYVLGHS